jgi:hypothetical protein
MKMIAIVITRIRFLRWIQLPCLSKKNSSSVSSMLIKLTNVGKRILTIEIVFQVTTQ